MVSVKPWKHDNFKVGTVSVFARKSWSGRDPVWANEVTYYNTAAKPLKDYLNRIVVHHTANMFNAKVNEGRHISRGFASLGYHFYISKQGAVYEGRPMELMGSHAGRGAKRRAS